MELTNIFKTKSHIEAMGIEKLLLENAVTCRVINKMDSPHANLFGNIEISVNQEDKIKAEQLIKEYFSH